MTRGEFVAELINVWEEARSAMEADGNDLAANQMKIALQVLKRTYAANELISND